MPKKNWFKGMMERYKDRQRARTPKVKPGFRTGEDPPVDIEYNYSFDSGRRTWDGGNITTTTTRRWSPADIPDLEYHLYLDEVASEMEERRIRNEPHRLALRAEEEQRAIEYHHRQARRSALYDYSVYVDRSSPIRDWAQIVDQKVRKYKDFDYMSDEDYEELEKLLDEDKNGHR